MDILQLYLSCALLKPELFQLQGQVCRIIPFLLPEIGRNIPLPLLPSEAFEDFRGDVFMTQSVLGSDVAYSPRFCCSIELRERLVRIRYQHNSLISDG
jgi:hypothetical protein